MLRDCAAPVAARHSGSGTWATLFGRGSGRWATLAPVPGRHSSDAGPVPRRHWGIRRINPWPSFTGSDCAHEGGSHRAGGAGSRGTAV